MLHRVSMGLVLALPAALLAGVLALGLTIPVPVLGRDYVIRLALPEGERPIALPGVEGPRDPSLPLVVIDPGHGGFDPGAKGEGFSEKAVVLGLASALREDLLRGGGIRVAMTRSDDRFLALDERVAMTRALGADLFVSIHADSAGEKAGINGASIYTLSERASSESAARFARRENDADQVNGVMLGGRSAAVNAILVELAQRRADASSSEFSNLVLREGAGRLQFHPEPQRGAALAVLRAPDVPSVLFESGFISNRSDATRLSSPEGRQAFAQVMSRAIRAFFARQAGT